MQQNNELTIWREETTIQEIRKCFAAKVNEIEWQTFLALGRATGLNPFLREIWIIKYKENAPASIFISRDGYRKSAQCQADYDYHVCDAVYANDQFMFADNRVYHKYQAVDRGALVGAYCFVKRKTSTQPHYQYVEAIEYRQFQSVWKEKPATMLKKVAEAQALRMAFQNIYVGTYSEYEMWKREEILARQANLQPLPQSSKPPLSALTEAIETTSSPALIDPFALTKEEKDLIIDQAGKMETQQKLNDLWYANSKRILSLGPVEKKLIIDKFSDRKRHLANEATKTQAAS